jgi:hemolysin activation/secretion protein
LNVKDRLPLHGHLEINNRGTLDTPPFRIDSALQYNNLWQLDHQVGLQYNFVPNKKKLEDQLPAFYDIPLVASYSGFYRMPIGSAKSMAEQFNNSPSDFGFDEVTRQFRRPPTTGQPELIVYASRSTTDSGVRVGPTKTIALTQLAEIYSVPSGEDLTITENLGGRLSYPLPDLFAIHSSISAGLDYKSYSLQSFNTNTTKFALFAIEQGERVFVKEADVPLDSQFASAVHYLPLALSWTASRKDRSGSSTFSLNNTLNLRALSSSDTSFQQVAGNSDASASFYVASMSFTREQKIYGDWDLLLRANGQWANKSVISNEQFGIGGTGGVRGYQEGEEYGDAGWRVLLEPRTPFVEIGMVDGTMPMRVRGSVFMDYGERYLYSPGPRDGTLAMLGAGFSVSAVVGQNFEGRFTLAWPILDTPNTPAGKGRAYFSVNAQF